MWQRLTLYDIRVIGHYLGSLVFYAAFVAIIPFVTGLLCMEWTAAARYLEAIGLFLITGMGLRFCRIQPGRLNRQQALVVTGLAWIVIALVAAIPLFQSGHYISYLDALFDAVSGVTTTGASVVVDLDHFSYADNMWRFMLHLVGGLGLLVVVLSLGLLGRGGGGSSALYSSEGRSEHVVPNVVQTAQFITRFSLAFVGASTILLMIICVFIGIEPLRAFLQAFWLSISAFMTAGFTPMSQSAMYYHSIGMEFIFMILMILGSISFGIHAEIRKGSVTAFFKDLEIRTMVIWLAVLTCVLAASLSASPNFSDLPAMLRRGLFTEISAFTTTGFMDITSTQLNSVFSSGAFMIIAIL
ncbi:MAG: potassium transporter TrkG, partial [Eggerthellaceae bacterium]